jgi:hypothetical protein
MDAAAIKKAADLYGMHREKIEGMKAAIVAGEAFRKAVEFENIISRYGARVITFNILSTACTWLDMDADDIERSLQELSLPSCDARETIR